jgi:RNA polymerase sigma-70 factor, ECF subfamily
LQQTFLVMWKKFDESFCEASFYAWASKIAYFEVLKSRDRCVRNESLLDRGVLEQIAAEDAKEPDFWDGVNSLLQACLDKLPLHDRELIERRYEPGMLVSVLAAELGRPVNSVSKSLGRIRRTLLKCVNEAAGGETNFKIADQAAAEKNEGETP